MTDYSSVTSDYQTFEIEVTPADEREQWVPPFLESVIEEKIAEDDQQQIDNEDQEQGEIQIQDESEAQFVIEDIN